MHQITKIFLISCIWSISFLCAINAAELKKNEEYQADTETAATGTSARLLNLGGILGQNPQYPPYYNRPNYYPGGNYYPSTGGSWSSGYYPSTGGYYPTTIGGGGGAYYPSGGSYYPSTNYNPSGYYPTNILGSGGYGGYGGYGGNGGFRQYCGYLNPNYMGRRNLGYGYYSNTDRYGLPRRSAYNDIY